MKDFLIIGVDGGATKVTAWVVNVDGDGKFSLGEISKSHSYAEYPDYDPGFVPVKMDIQLQDFTTDRIRVTDAEMRQATVYTKACAEAIIDVARKSGQSRLLVGVGMPGLKTKDQRGIAVMANGPRQVDYAANLEQRLVDAGLKLEAPIDHIGSDAFYCGLGEEFASDGQFRNVTNSYYLGGGTGAADALKLNGELISLDDIRNWFVKTWEIKCPENRSIETYVSSKGIQSLYAELSAFSLEELNQKAMYPPQILEAAYRGDSRAKETFEKVAKYLALLIYERITTLFAGWQGLFRFLNPNRPEPEVQHPYHGSVFDTIIIGQRLGEMLKQSGNDTILWQPFRKYLNMLICESAVLDEKAKAHYCTDGCFREERLAVSQLREAPALGAGIDAYLTYGG